MRALNVAATGMHAQQRNVEVISNNIANQTTTAFKRQRAEFQDLIYQSFRRVGTNSADTGIIVPTGVEMGLGVKTGAVYRIHEQGSLQQTENILDLAIQGKGYFRVELPDGDFAYTRAGAFQLSPEGEIITVDGYLVSPGINVPDDAIDLSVNSSGEVEILLDGQIEPTNLGQLEVYSFVNEGGLRALGDNLFAETAASGDAIAGIAGEEDFGTILQGFVETSNVNAVTEITNLILAQRTYEMNSRVITASDEMMQSLNQT